MKAILLFIGLVMFLVVFIACSSDEERATITTVAIQPTPNPMQTEQPTSTFIVVTPSTPDSGNLERTNSPKNTPEPTRLAQRRELTTFGNCTLSDSGVDCDKTVPTPVFGGVGEEEADDSTEESNGEPATSSDTSSQSAQTSDDSETSPIANPIVSDSPTNTSNSQASDSGANPDVEVTIDNGSGIQIFDRKDGLIEVFGGVASEVFIARIDPGSQQMRDLAESNYLQFPYPEPAQGWYVRVYYLGFENSERVYQFNVYEGNEMKFDRALLFVSQDGATRLVQREAE